MQFEKRVPVEKFLQHKDEYAECCNEYMTVKPADMYGNVAPLGNSAADRSRNIKGVAEDLKYRMGC